MMLFRLSRCCCCCAAPGKSALTAAQAARLAELRELFRRGVDGGGDISALQAELDALEALAGESGDRMTEGNAGAIARIAEELAGVPVWAESKCGSDRDCIPDGRWRDNYEQAIASAEGWNSVNPSRYVEIYSAPGGILITKVGPSGSVEVTTQHITRAVAGSAIEEQRGKLSTYG